MNIWALLIGICKGVIMMDVNAEFNFGFTQCPVVFFTSFVFIALYKEFTHSYQSLHCPACTITSTIRVY